MSVNKPYIIGIAGGSGSGKTTLAKALLNELGTQAAMLLSQDSFYLDKSHLPPNERDTCNFDHPDAINWSQFIQVLEQVSIKSTVNIPLYDFASHCQIGHQKISVKETIIVDGHLILTNPMVASLFDISFFLSIDLDLMFIRRLQRDISERGRSARSVCDQYTTTVRPMYLQFILPSQKNASVILEANKTSLLQDVMKHLTHLIKE
jgi:uridine kinase